MKKKGLVSGAYFNFPIEKLLKDSNTHDWTKKDKERTCKKRIQQTIEK